jgi:hypothetical protein
MKTYATTSLAECWSEFYRIYGNLIRYFALRAGVNDTEGDARKGL